MMNNKTIIYLVRHGETEWNVEHKLQGHHDSPLTELGIKQAEWLGKSIENDQIDVIYSSSSLRARRTSELIRDKREIHIIWNDPERFNVENSETFQDVSNRVINKLHQIINENKGKSILIVTHTVIVKLIMAHFEDRPIKNIWNPPYIHPACLCKIAIESNKPKIILYGDTSHFKEEPSVS